MIPENKKVEDVNKDLIKEKESIKLSIAVLCEKNLDMNRGKVITKTINCKIDEKNINFLESKIDYL